MSATLSFQPCTIQKSTQRTMQEVKDFYVDVLGFEVGFRPQLSGPGLWLYAGSKAMVHLSEDDGRAPRRGKDYLDHIAMRCVGVNEYAKKLKEHAIHYRPVYNAEIDLTQLFFDDPTRITIELNFKGEKLLEN